MKTGEKFDNMSQLSSRLKNSEKQMDQLNYLWEFVGNVSPHQTLVSDGKQIHLFPHVPEDSSKKISLGQKVDLSLEWTILGLEELMTLNGILEMMRNPENAKIVLSTEIYSLGPEKIKELLRNKLEEIRNNFFKNLYRIPVVSMFLMIAESVSPAPSLLPIPVATLPMIKPMFSLIRKYKKNIKEINELIESLDVRSFELQEEVGLTNVETELKNGNFEIALSRIDDLDGVLGNKMFTREMLSAAEWISLQKDSSLKKESALKRMKILIESNFWKGFFAKKKIDNSSTKSNSSFAEAWSAQRFLIQNSI